MSDAWWLLVPLGAAFLIVAWMVVVDVRRIREALLDEKNLRQSSFTEEDTEWGGEE